MKTIRVASAALWLLVAACTSTDGGRNLDDVAVATSALTISSNSTGTVTPWFYTFWKDGGSTTMNVNADGTFSVNWYSGSYNFVGGPGWSYGLTSREIGYNCSSYPGVTTSSSYLTLYGWSRSPLVEYYILQSWGNYDPPCPGDGACTQGVNFTSNGVTYQTWRTQRVNRPSIDSSSSTFYQYWSKPTAKQSVGSDRVIKFQDHVTAWASNGWNLGNLNATGGTDPTYQVMAIEVFGPNNTATANCKVWDATPAAGTCSDGIKNQTETGIDCGGPCAACAATCSDGIQNQTETGIDCGGPCAACPSYTSTNVNTTSGTTSESAGTITVAGEGTDIYGTTDEFRYVYKAFTGNGSMIAKVASVQNTNAWAKGAVMIRQSLTGTSKYAMMMQAPDKKLQFQWRTTDGQSIGSSQQANPTTPTAWQYLKLTKNGTSISAYYSADGTTWTQAGATQTIDMGTGTVYAGLAVCSHVNDTLCTATFTNVSWPGCSSAADCNDNNACTDDACNAGSCSNTNNTAPCTDDSNACTSDVCSAGACTHPAVTNGTTCNDSNACTTTDICTSGVCGGTAMNCDDSNPCTTDACSAGSCSNTTVANGTTCNDNVSTNCNDMCTAGVCGGSTCPANVPPTTSITSPAAGASFTAPASVTINANAADSDGTVSKVEFYNGATLLGSDTTSPYSYSWTGVAAGSYSLTTIAYDNVGATTTSAAVSITVGACSLPAAPASPAATAGNAQATLSWTAVSGATSYNVLRSTTSGSGYTSVATGVTTTSYVNTGLTNGTAYYYVIAAVSSCGTGSNSTQVSVTPVAGSTPCAGLCSPIVVKTGQSQSSGNVGTGAICHETSGVTFGGGQVSNLSTRTITINGASVGNTGSWTIPAKRNNGYCIQITAGTPDYTAYSTW